VRSSSTTPLFAKTSTDIYFVARPSNEKIRSLELEISRLKEQLLGSKASTIALIELDDNNSLSEQDHESDLPFDSTSIMTCNHPPTPIDTPKILYCADPVQTLINPLIQPRSLSNQGLRPQLDTQIQRIVQRRILGIRARRRHASTNIRHLRGGERDCRQRRQRQQSVSGSQEQSLADDLG
jgi:hypothetical protein